MKKILCDECNCDVDEDQIGSPRVNLHFGVGGFRFHIDTRVGTQFGIELPKGFAVCRRCVREGLRTAIGAVSPDPAPVAPQPGIGARVWRGPGGALVSDREIPGITQKLSPENAKGYTGPFFIGETLTKGAAEFIATALGATLVDPPPADLNDKLPSS